MPADHRSADDQAPNDPAAEELPLGVIEATGPRFVWSPPLTDESRSARRRIRWSAASVIVVATVWAGSVAADGADAVVLALIVPLMLLGMAVGIDRLFAVAGRLRIEVADGTLAVLRGRRRDAVAVVDVTGLAVRHRSARDRRHPAGPGWSLVVDRAGAEPLSVLVPDGIGSAFDRHEAAALQAELRRRCNL